MKGTNPHLATMGKIKVIKDAAVRSLLGNDLSGVNELREYLRDHGAIHFERVNLPDGTILAKSTNFRCGSIITSGKNEAELDSNIKDAILTSFDIPSVYLAETHLQRIGQSEEYALA